MKNCEDEDETEPIMEKGYSETTSYVSEDDDGILQPESV